MRPLSVDTLTGQTSATHQGLTVSASFGHVEIFAGVTNNTRQTARVMWDEAAFVNVRGQATPILTSTSGSQRYSPATASSAPAGSSVTLPLAPQSALYEGDRFPSIIVPAHIAAPCLRPTVEQTSRIDSLAEANVGKTMSLLLPVQIGEARREYTFVFRVDSVARPTPAPSEPALASPPRPTVPEIVDYPDERPEIDGGLSGLNARAVYPETERRAGVEGRVIVHFIVGLDGLPSQVEVHQSLSPGLDRAAIRAVQRSRFSVGRLRGRPVAVRMTIPVTFSLPVH